MESMKQAQDQLDGLIKLADFLKDVRGLVQKSSDLPAQITNLEKTKASISKEVDDLMKKRAELLTNIKAEHDGELKAMEIKNKEINSKLDLLNDERAKVKNETDRLKVKDAMLSQKMDEYKKAKEEYELKSKELDDKLQRIGEVAGRK